MCAAVNLGMFILLNFKDLSQISNPYSLDNCFIYSSIFGSSIVLMLNFDISKSRTVFGVICQSYQLSRFWTFLSDLFMIFVNSPIVRTISSNEAKKQWRCFFRSISNTQRKA